MPPKTVPSNCLNCTSSNFLTYLVMLNNNYIDVLNNENILAQELI